MNEQFLDRWKVAAEIEDIPIEAYFPEIRIVKDEKFYSLDPQEKIVTVSNTKGNPGVFFMSAFRRSFPLVTISDDTQSGKVLWQKSVPRVPLFNSPMPLA